MNNRRKFLVVLGAGAFAAPLSSFAQQSGKVWRIGFLGSDSPFGSKSHVEALRAGLRDLGYLDGKNIAIDFRGAEGNYERLPELAAELVRLKVDVIVTAGSPATAAAQKVTTTTPIVMTRVSDPVASGFVASLRRPEGNITGLTGILRDISPKHMEMLLGVVPKLFRVAVLVNPGNASHATILKDVQAAAQRAGVKILLVEAGTPQEIENAFSTMVKGKAGAVIVASDGLFLQQRRQIAELAMKNQLPSISSFREWAESGLLMSYGSNLSDQYRRAATYVDKILKGTKPGDLPVEQPTTLELIINNKTAKALGLKIPADLLLRADKVIE
jgi:putative ABC transport system substrate-binding protein